LIGIIFSVRLEYVVYILLFCQATRSRMLSRRRN